ncbi:MAG: hypothetical protein GVY32_11530 [Gammaproteobacteria bacterium]|jgi:DUF4097 and DUF4098 domain-containing protein YvlB|nr:hypothetical protein [Gammaproteobacteria bacterium]
MKQTASLFLTCFLLVGCGAVMGDFSLADGSTHNDDVSVVNGSISIGDDCRVNGDVSSVNGSIRVGANSVVGEISAVNGSVSLAENVSVSGPMENVNGRVSIGSGSRIAGSVSTVNGRIQLDAGAVSDGTVSTVNGHIKLVNAEVAGLGTTNGNLELLEGSHVKGRLKVAKPQGFSLGDHDPVRVVIGAGSTVDGPLIFERSVALFVHETATIGEVEGAEPQSFSGDSP